MDRDAVATALRALVRRIYSDTPPFYSYRSQYEPEIQALADALTTPDAPVIDASQPSLPGVDTPTIETPPTWKPGGRWDALSPEDRLLVLEHLLIGTADERTAWSPLLFVKLPARVQDAVQE